MSETTILCSNNGPLRISGRFVIQDAQGNVFDLSGREAISLCRCGQSSNKPFCDGTHNRVGFQSEVQARKLPPPAPKPAL
ncbi:MAG: iron-binding protein [Acidobacteria bacterium]|nr:MAG: iron-binding protein [Acidobacteriota bacterium]